MRKNQKIITIHDRKEFYRKSKKKPYLTLACVFSRDSTSKLEKIRRSLRDIDKNHIYMQPGTYHITLKELGWLDEDITQDEVDWMVRQLDGIGNIPPFKIKINGFTSFSDALVLKVMGAEPIKRLHLLILKRIREKIKANEFEGSRFSPHVSVLYFGSKHVERLFDKMKAMKTIRVGSITVDSFCLIYGYPHLLLSPLKRERAKSFKCVKRFYLGKKVGSKRTDRI